MLNLIHPDDHGLVTALQRLCDGWWIAGGTPLRWYQQRPADSDVDLYFNCQDSYDRMHRKLQQLYDKGLAGTYNQWFNGLRVDRVHTTDNAVTWSMSITRGNDNADEYSIQCIKRRFYDDPIALVDDFDITVCQIATDGQRVWTGDDFARDVAAGRLRFNTLTPNSGKRLVKYWIYGFTPDDETIQRICDQPQLATRSDDDY